MRKIVLIVLCSCTFLLASVNINMASKKELMSLKGIGEKKAALILEYRKNKKFESIGELKQLKGFGNKLLLKLKEEISVK